MWARVQREESVIALWGTGSPKELSCLPGTLSARLEYEMVSATMNDSHVLNSSTVSPYTYAYPIRCSLRILHSFCPIISPSLQPFAASGVVPLEA